MPSAEEWREELASSRRNLSLREPCTRAAILEAEAALKLRFPDDLRHFYRATDGAYDEDAFHEYAWCLQRLVAENRRHRPPTADPLVLPSDLLGVGDDAAGGWFCLSLATNEGVHYGWMGDERHQVARDLRGLWRGWFGGEFRI